MTITFADGTRIEVPATSLDDFVKYDLQWVEFVHGSAEKPAAQRLQPAMRLQEQNTHRCPAC
jgi:hypothetical protein